MRRILWTVLMGMGLLCLNATSASAGMVFHYLLDNNG
jgi:hypothetical protein